MASIKELMSLEGRVAAVTGGAGNIGSAIALALAELGCRVALLDTAFEAASAKAEEIEAAQGVSCLAWPTDLADHEAVAAAPALVAEALGGLDIIVNTAAFVGAADMAGWSAPFTEQSRELWARTVDVNAISPAFLTQAALPWLKAKGRGSVINIASVYGFLGPDMRIYDGLDFGNPGGYAASKGALIQMTRWLATVLATEVRVNCLTPGAVERAQPELFKERFKARVPLGRLAATDDIIGAAVFLASDLSAYVTGQHILVDGGFSIW